MKTFKQYIDEAGRPLGSKDKIPRGGVRWTRDKLKTLKKLHIQHSGHIESIRQGMTRETDDYFEKHDITQALHRYHEQLGLPKPSGWSSKVNPVEVFKHRKKGLLDQDIAKKLGVSHPTLHYAMKKHDDNPVHPDYVPRNLTDRWKKRKGIK